MANSLLIHTWFYSKVLRLRVPYYAYVKSQDANIVLTILRNTVPNMRELKYTRMHCFQVIIWHYLC